MAESSDRYFLRPRELLSADRIDFYDAINLVIYAKLPLLSALKGRDLIAGYIRRDEMGAIKPLLSFPGEADLLKRYAHYIDRFTFPIGPTVYEPLLDHMSRANEYALPYFFHEHHLMVDRRRRAALFALQYKELQSDVMKGNVTLQSTEAELTSLLVSGSWMTNETLKGYLRKRGVLPWWENDANLSTHAVLERMVLSDSFTRLPASAPGDVVDAPQHLPELFSPRWAGPGTRLQGSPNTAGPAGQDHTLSDPARVAPSVPDRGLLQRFLAAVTPVSSDKAARKGADQAAGQANLTEAAGAQTSSVHDLQPGSRSPMGDQVRNQHPDADTRTESIPVDVRVISSPVPPEHEAYDEQQGPSFLLADKLLRHSRFRRGDQQAPWITQAPSMLSEASSLPHFPTETLGSPAVSRAPRQDGKATTTEPKGPVTHPKRMATDIGEIGAVNTDSYNEHGLGNDSDAPAHRADPYADEGLMTRDEVAAFINRHVNSVDNYRKQPDFPAAVYIGDSPMWKRGQIRKWRDRKPAK